jgi:hypothetical protein
MLPSCFPEIILFCKMRNHEDTEAWRRKWSLSWSIFIIKVITCFAIYDSNFPGQDMKFNKKYFVFTAIVNFVHFVENFRRKFEFIIIRLWEPRSIFHVVFISWTIYIYELFLFENQNQLTEDKCLFI